MTEYRLSQHALEALEKRQIKREWLERALESPETREPDRADSNLEHRLVRIPEFGNRLLRLVVNSTAQPVFVVTIFFDRRQKEDK